MAARRIAICFFTSRDQRERLTIRIIRAKRAPDF